MLNEKDVISYFDKYVVVFGDSSILNIIYIDILYYDEVILFSHYFIVFLRCDYIRQLEQVKQLYK